MRPHQVLTRWRPFSATWRPVIGLAFLIVALVAMTVMVSKAAFEEPHYSMAVAAARCQHADGHTVTADKPTHFPFVRHARGHETANLMRCEFDLRLTADEIRNAALLIPSFSDSVAVDINGHRVAVAELYTMRNLRFSTIPAFVPSLDNVLRPGVNGFQVTVSALPGHAIALDRIYIGARKDLRPYYHARWFVSATLPTVVVGAEIALAIVFALIWAARPREMEFGWLAVTLALGAMRGSVLMPDFGIGAAERPFWNVLVVWEMAAGLMFCRALTRTPNTRWTWLLALPPLVVTLLYAFGPLTHIPDLVRSAMAVIVVYLSASVWTLGRAALRGDRDALIVMPGLLVMLAFVGREVAVILDPGSSRVFLARAVYSGFLLGVAALMTLRFVRAMGRLDNAAAALGKRVAEVETELRATYEELRVRREAEAVERERARLMRDLHDGIGGELASMLALADAPEPKPQEISRHARAALTDMRLIIGSLEDYGGDLSLALGAWRERAEPQVRAARLKLVWDVRDVPTLVRFGPAQVLDVLRIVQEAVTNVIKHARATRIRIETSGDEDAISISICDDGQGIASDAGGNGIGNMRMRAARLGGQLTLDRVEGETRVTLRIPRLLPSTADSRPPAP